MTSEIDLWTGTITETGDEMWVAYTYNDDAIQFIHTESHAQVWQGRTVVGDEFNRGRVESHYSHSTDSILLVAATGIDRPPEQERVFSGDEFEFEFGSLSEDTLESVLRTLLAEWVSETNMAAVDYPGDDDLEQLEPLASEIDTESPVVDEVSGQDLFDSGLSTIKSDNPSTQ